MDASDAPERIRSLERKAVILALFAIFASAYGSFINYVGPLAHLNRPDAYLLIYDDRGSPSGGLFANMNPYMQEEVRSELRGRRPIYMGIIALQCIGPLVAMAVYSWTGSWVRRIALVVMYLYCLLYLVAAAIPPRLEESLEMRPDFTLYLSFLAAAATVGGLAVIGMAESLVARAKRLLLRADAPAQV